MNVQEQIDDYISSQPPSKGEDLRLLDQTIRRVSPNCRLWYLDGRDSEGRIVTNPNIGYGLQSLTYTSGETRDFYKIGISANSFGISIYFFGITDKQFLRRVYAEKIGKATITGYCVKLKKLRDVNLDTIEQMVVDHFSGESAGGP